jgi:hypothetical protein
MMPQRLLFICEEEQPQKDNRYEGNGSSEITPHLEIKK